MKDLTVGMYARSLAGHDKGTMYVIAETEGDMVYLTDGRLRKMENPKRKKRKHIQPDYAVAAVLQERIARGIPMRDEDIRKAIKTKEV